MEEFQSHRDEALKRLKVADHLLLVTYPLVKDPKLLLTVTDNLYKCYAGGMDAVLEYERVFKRVPILPESFGPRFSVFAKEVAPKHGIRKEHLHNLEFLRDVIQSHKKSPVEFTREGKFVISDENYRLRTVSSDVLKAKIKNAKEFLKQVEEVISENERIFG